MSRPQADVAGQTFDRLTALHPDGKSEDGRIMWLCLCRCGNHARVNVSALRSGTTKSCGCLRRELGRAHLAIAHAKRWAR